MILSPRLRDHLFKEKTVKEQKVVINREVPFWLVPARALYRFCAKNLFSSNLRIRQLCFNGIQYLVWENEDIGKKLILLKSFEANETKLFQKIIKNGDVCVDVGGNVGYFSLLFAQLTGIQGKVFSFEPIMRNYLVIKLAAEINAIKNLTVVDSVVSDHSGECFISIPSSDGAYAHLTNGKQKQNNTINVRSTTLDAFAKEQGIKIDVLKIDVEGAEKLVLDGSTNILSELDRRPRVVMIELVDEFLMRFGSTVQEIIDVMSAFNYAPYYAGDKGEFILFSPAQHNKIFNVFFVNKANLDELAKPAR